MGIEIKTYDDWKDEVQVISDKLHFEIKCTKCKSKEIQIISANNTGYSECTGIWGSVDFVIKCKTCGNAYSIEVEQS